MDRSRRRALRFNSHQAIRLMLRMVRHPAGFQIAAATRYKDHRWVGKPQAAGPSNRAASRRRRATASRRGLCLPHANPAAPSAA